MAVVNQALGLLEAQLDDVDGLSPLCPLYTCLWSLLLIFTMAFPLVEESEEQLHPNAWKTRLATSVQPSHAHYSPPCPYSDNVHLRQYQQPCVELDKSHTQVHLGTSKLLHELLTVKSNGEEREELAAKDSALD